MPKLTLRAAPPSRPSAAQGTSGSPTTAASSACRDHCFLLPCFLLRQHTAGHLCRWNIKCTYDDMSQRHHTVMVSALAAQGGQRGAGRLPEAALRAARPQRHLQWRFQGLQPCITEMCATHDHGCHLSPP